MSQSDMKSKVVHGLFWKILENGGAQAVQFGVAVLLARLMSPAEYGTVGLIMIFITIANVIVQNSFATALIQKKEVDHHDFSSVFFFNLAVAGVMYLLLFLGAPAIERFYRIDALQMIVRVMALVLFPGAVISVQTAYVSRSMEFKGLFLSTLAASVISGIVSVWMAYRGHGVWAMVMQQIIYYFALMCVMFVTVHWRPTLTFLPDRIRGMFSFGGKLLLASLIDNVFNNLYGLIIGKAYSQEALGSYNRGEQFPKLIASNLGAAIQAVLLPAFSACQDNLETVRGMVRRAIRMSSFVILPMLFGLFGVADTLVLGLLGEQWLVCVPFLRIMCITYCFWPIHITNLQAINALGRSDVFLKLEVIKKLLGIVGLVIGMQFDVITMVIIKAVIDFFCTFINAWPNKKLLNYSIFSQWADIMPSCLISVIMCVCVLLVGQVLPIDVWMKLLVQMVTGAAVYVLLAWVLRFESFREIVGLVKNRRER